MIVFFWSEEDNDCSEAFSSLFLKEDFMPYKKFLQALTNISDFFTNNPHLSSDERRRMADSYLNFAQKIRSSFVYGVNFKAGDICRVELGVNVAPEMSYQHMCVVLGKNGHLYYVVPITSLNRFNSYHTNAYHPIDNPTGRKNFILLKQSEFPSFLRHDSVVKCEDLKSVSEKRISNKIANIYSNSLYQEIRIAILQMIFSPELRESKLIKIENSLLRMKLELANIPCEVLDKADIYIDAKYNPMIVELADNKLELKLTDSYGQSEIKIISIKQIEQD